MAGSGGTGLVRQAQGAGLALLAPAVLFLVAFYLLPLGLLVEESLRPSAGGMDPAAPMGLHQYERVISSGRSWRALERTVRISAVSTLLTFVIAYPMALFLLRAGPRLRTAIVLSLFVSLASSLIVRNYG
jgi:ABC-type spermidine/putrescine transport system permease subunit I